MNRIEDRLRDAFAAAAETVRPEAVSVLRAQARPARTRRLAPLVAAIAVAIVIIGASVITPLAVAGGHSAPSRPAGPSAPSTAPSARPSHAVVIVPMVVGMTGNQAAAVLQAVGLVTVLQGNSAVPPGIVIAQNPAAGTALISGATITLTVASGSGSSPATASSATG